MHFYTSAAALSLAALLPVPVDAFWRMPCPSRLLDQRMDPLIAPGVVSAHVHQIAGGNGFGYTETFEDARSSSCTSCPITADYSNYWSPTLYYEGQDGTFTKASQMDTPGSLGGMTVYYLQRGGPNNDTLLAFPEGFRMIAGNPFKRNFTNDFAADAISFVCLDYDGGSSSPMQALPTTPCPNGMRAQVFFPSCWDGVNLDSPDHSSHVSYPAIGSNDNGICPESHPFHLVSLFYEVTYNTSAFPWWEGNHGTGQPYVFAMGDPTGYGFHGDFINGWDVPTLQKAVDNCDDAGGVMQNCPYFEFFDPADNQLCKLPHTVDEDIYGPFDALPGCNPVTTTYEAALAAFVADCPVASIGAPEIVFTDVSRTMDWAYIGCIVDPASSSTRTLNGAGAGYTNEYNTDQSMTTVEWCLDMCNSKGFLYGGLEDGHQCFCDNTLADGREPVPYSWCQQPCVGNSSQYCGGAQLVSLYKSCNGSSSCTNVQYGNPIGDLKGGSTAVNQPIVFTELQAAISTAVAELTSFPANFISATYSGVVPVTSDISATAVASTIGTATASLSAFLSSVTAADVSLQAADSTQAFSVASAYSSATSSSIIPTSSSSTTKATSVAAKVHVASTIVGAGGSSSSSHSSSSTTTKSPHATSRTSSKSGAEYITVTEIDTVTMTETVTAPASAAASKRAAKKHQHAHAHAHANKRHDF